ncbi:transcription factor-like 5 protein [Labrus bergylta]|uniref:transcription factor-like 5 protein n=1 Tax=Labrus bergylta TaxID=56723 RepID=UPI0033136FC2
MLTISFQSALNAVETVFGVLRQVMCVHPIYRLRMSFFSSYKTLHVSPSYREHTCDSEEVSQSVCLTHDQGQMLGPELGVVEMSEVDYSHLQHLIQSQMETQAAPRDGSDARAPPDADVDEDTTGSPVISPYTTTQAMDLSTSTDEPSLLMPGEKTPASFGEVPGFVLARMRGEGNTTEPRTNSSISSQKRSAARVCLETRFNTVSADTPRHFLTILQQSSENQEAVTHSQMQKWMKTDRANPFEVSCPFVGGVFNPVTNMCEQVINHLPHMNDPKHQGSNSPKSLSLSLRADRVFKKAHYTSRSNMAENQQSVNTKADVATSAASRKLGIARNTQPMKGAKAAPDSVVESGSGSRKKSRSSISPSRRRERHNSKERERRKRIRLCCDELNLLVPFCNLDTDKVTTLQWTTTFLRYISDTYGDTFKEEFKMAFSNEKELFLKSRPSPGQDLMHEEMDETLTIPLVVEQ